MSKRNSMEEEINDRIDLELLKDELEGEKTLEDNNEAEDLSELSEEDRISKNAVNKLINEDDTEEINPEVSRPICEFESDTEYFEPEPEDEDSLIYTGVVGTGIMLGEDEKLKEHDAKEELLSKDYEVETEVSRSRLKKYTVVAGFSIIAFLLALTFGLVLYIQKIKNDEKKVLAQTNLENSETKATDYDDDYVDSLIRDNNRLNQDIESLRNELAAALSKSSADVSTNEVKEEPKQEEPVVEEPVVEEPVVKEPVKKAEPKEEKPKTYIVKKGDTLQGISKKMYGNVNSYKKIVDANNIKNDIIRIGQKLNIP